MKKTAVFVFCLSLILGFFAFADDVTRYWNEYGAALRQKDYPAAAEALRRMAQTNTLSAAEKILGVLKDEKIPQEVYEGAVTAIGMFTAKDVLAQIAKKGASGDFRLKVSLAKAVAKTPADDIFQMLISFLSDKNNAVVREAIEALKLRGDSRAVDSLIDLVEREEKVKGLEWEAAQYALRELTGCDKELIDAIDWRNWWTSHGKKPIEKKKQEAQPKEKIAALEKKLKETTVSVAMKEKPLKEIVEFLKNSSGVNIVIDKEVNADKQLTLEVANVPLEEAIRLLVEQADIDYEVREDGVYILKTAAHPVAENPQGKALEKFRTEMPSFFGREIVSKRVVFVLDVSGSMNEGRPPRIKRVQDELKKVIDSLSSEATFNLIAFNNKVMVWNQRMQKASKETKEAAKRFVDSFKADGQTHTDEALKAAFDIDDIDSIYLLSDGAPYKAEHGSTLSISFIEGIIEWVAKSNRFKRVRIHTFGFEEMAKEDGAEICVDFLKRLAKDSGGTFTNIK